MAKVTKPVILDETGKDIRDALDSSAAAILAAITDGFNKDMTLQEVVDARDNFTSLGQNIKQKPYYFNNVAEMKASNLKANDVAITLGYYEPNDGGSAIYKIVNSASQTEIQESLDNNKYANLIVIDHITPELLGAYGDGTHDDSVALNLMFNSNCQNFINKNYYKFTNILISNKELVNISGGKFEGHFEFNNCNKVVFENIEFISGNNSFDEIVNCLNCKKIVIKNCKFNGKLIKQTTKGLKVLNTTDFECINSNFDNFDGYTDVDILPNGNSAGSNTRNQTSGLFFKEVTNIKVYNCNFNNIQGRCGVYVENCSNIDINNNNFSNIFGPGIHIGNYYKNISIKNNYLQFCAITGTPDNYLYLNGGRDGAIDIYGAENYYPFLATDSSVEISHNYFYKCGTSEPFNTEYYVYTDSTKTTLATTYSDGTPIGTQPITVTNKLGNIRTLNSFSGDIHDNTFIYPSYRVLSCGTRTKYSSNDNNSTVTNNQTIKFNSNKILLDKYCDVFISGTTKGEFADNIIQAISSNNNNISTDERSSDYLTAKYLVDLETSNFNKIANNIIISDVYAGIKSRGSSSLIENNTIQVWSFALYVQTFVNIRVNNNFAWVGITQDSSDLHTGAMFIDNTSQNTNCTCLLTGNFGNLIEEVCEYLLAKTRVSGIANNNKNTNSGNLMSYATPSTIFKIKTPQNDKYYLQLSNGTKKEFEFE